VVSHISRKTSEMWGTPRFLEGVGVAGGRPVDCLRGCYDRWDGRGRVVVSHDSWWGWGLLDKRWCGLGGFVGDVGLDGVLHQLAAAVERQLFFDVSLVGFDGFYAEV
jgi:hypothetical protein